jgi:predicted secreted protein
MLLADRDLGDLFGFFAVMTIVWWLLLYVAQR